MSARSWNRIVCWAAALLVAASPFAAQAADMADCERDRCGLLADGPYENLASGAVQPRGPRIDPVSLLPVHGWEPSP